jgi:hypothetical protein
VIDHQLKRIGREVIDKSAAFVEDHNVRLHKFRGDPDYIVSRGWLLTNGLRMRVANRSQRAEYEGECLPKKRTNSEPHD